MSNFTQAPFNKIRKDKFIMVIPVPKGLKDIVSNFNHSNNTISHDAFTISIFGAVAPPISVPAVDNKYSGQSIKTTSYARPSYPPLSISFTIDNRFSNYWFIYKWLDILNDDKKSIYDANDIVGVTADPPTDPSVGVYSGTYSKQLQYYATDISIYALDEYEKRVIEFKYFGAFPTSIGGLNMSYRDAGEAETTAEFAYSQFTASLVENVDSL